MKVLTLAAILAAVALPVAAETGSGTSKAPTKQESAAARKDCAKLAKMQRQSPRNHRPKSEKAEAAPKA